VSTESNAASCRVGEKPTQAAAIAGSGSRVVEVRMMRVLPLMTSVNLLLLTPTQDPDRPTSHNLIHLAVVGRGWVLYCT
jgi:hypothetical protein